MNHILKDYIPLWTFTYVLTNVQRVCHMYHSHPISHINYLESNPFSCSAHSLMLTACEVIWGCLNFKTTVGNTERILITVPRLIYIILLISPTSGCYVRTRWGNILPITHIWNLYAAKEVLYCPMVRILLEVSILSLVSDISS